MAREIVIPTERVVQVGSSALGGMVNGVLWRFAPVNLPTAVLSTSALAVGGLMGSIWTRGMSSTLFAGLASGSAGVLGFITPLLVGVPATARRVGTQDSRIIQTRTQKALPGPAGERIAQRIAEAVELSSV
jgi:hypothetical protein